MSSPTHQISCGVHNEETFMKQSKEKVNQIGVWARRKSMQNRLKNNTKLERSLKPKVEKK